MLPLLFGDARLSVQLQRMVAWSGIPFAFAVAAAWSNASALQLTVVDATLGWSSQPLMVRHG